MFAGLSCVFLVCCSDATKKSAVDRTVLANMRRTELANTKSGQYSTFIMVFDNLSEADGTVKSIRALDSVKSVRMGIMKELIVVQDWRTDEIGKRIMLGTVPLWVRSLCL